MEDMVRYKFRSAGLGGFNRQDVAAYIEASAKKYESRINTLSTENEALEAKCRQLEEQLESKAGDIAALEARCGKLEAEVERLSAPAEAEAEPEPEDESEAEPDDIPEPESVSSARTILDAVKPRTNQPEQPVEEGSTEAPVPEVEVVPGDAAELKDGREILASIKIFYPRKGQS